MGVPESLANALQRLQQLALHGLVAGNHLAVPDAAGLAGIIAHGAARFADHQLAGRHVPGSEPAFPIAVEAAGGEPARSVEAEPVRRMPALAGAICASWRSVNASSSVAVTLMPVAMTQSARCLRAATRKRERSLSRRRRPFRR